VPVHAAVGKREITAMVFEDDYDDSRPRSGHGVSPVWQILGIAGLLGTVVLLLLVLVLAGALAREREHVLELEQAGAAGVVMAPRFAPAVPRGPAVMDGAVDEPPNPPYPVKDDLRPAGPPVVPGEEPQDARPRTARQRFLELGQPSWTAPEGPFPQQLTVSPDGQRLAFLQQQQLLVGTVGGRDAQLIEIGGGNPGMPPAGIAGWPAGFAQPAPNPLRAVGTPAWSSDNQHLLFVDADGALRRYNVDSQLLEALPFYCDSPVPVPGDSNKVIFRRSRAVPKLDRPDRAAEPDPSEVVLADLNTQEVRVLVPVSNTVWQPLAVSPDGKKLALASDLGQAKKGPGTFRLFVLDLGAADAKPAAVGPPGIRPGAVSWADDGRSLVYSHGRQPQPSEWWEGDDTEWAGVDLYHLDLATGRETRLSRGGVRGLSPTAGNDLFVLITRDQGQRPRIQLLRVPVAAALDFAKKEPDPPPRTPEAWTALIDRVLEETRVPPDAGGDKLTEEGLAGLADTFARLYRERFHAEPPADAEGWERQGRELTALNLPRAARARFSLVLGAAHGEYLRRRHHAVWHLSAGPLISPVEPTAEPPGETPFSLVVNPFVGVTASLEGGDGDEGSPSGWGGVKDALIRAEGRVVVLANDPAVGKAVVEKVADEALERAVKLFAEKKNDEAERVLLQMMKEKHHESNRYLALHVGRLLFEQKRFDALRGFMEKQVNEPPDARVYNLLGLALLDSDPETAIGHFKDALRCELYFGPGYLNLARAYEKALKRQEAQLCLRRYLKLMPFGSNAGDARQRLAALEQFVDADAAAGR
jgi:tetratricopeptide (TPR) repeat protein